MLTRHSSLRRWSCLALALAVCCLPQAARADCAQPDIEGRWKAYATVSGPMGMLWVNCNLNIEAGGKISSGTCDSPQKNFSMSLGNITIADTTNCAFAGYLEFDGSPVRVEHATLSPEKTVMAGAGAFTRGFFTFTMVKTGA